VRQSRAQSNRLSRRTITDGYKTCCAYLGRITLRTLARVHLGFRVQSQHKPDAVEAQLYFWSSRNWSFRHANDTGYMYLHLVTRGGRCLLRVKDRKNASLKRKVVETLHTADTGPVADRRCTALSGCWFATNSRLRRELPPHLEEDYLGTPRRERMVGPRKHHAHMSDSAMLLCCRLRTASDLDCSSMETAKKMHGQVCVSRDDVQPLFAMA
jgi:hypothetical protein